MTRESKRKTDSRFLDLARDISDGTPVPWDTEGGASPEDTAALERLRALEAVVSAHRSLKLPGTDAATAEVIPARATSADPGVWGPLAVGDKVAQGTRGEVYRTQVDGREVALHLRREDWPVNPEFIPGFLKETTRQTGLRDANLLPVLGGAVHGGRPGLWTQWYRGMTLEESLVVRGVLPAGECSRVVLGLLSGLKALALAGLAGYGVDPSRVLITTDGRILLGNSGRLFLRDEEISGLSDRGPEHDFRTLGHLVYRASTGRVWIEGVELPGKTDLPAPLIPVIESLLTGASPDEDVLQTLQVLANPA